MGYFIGQSGNKETPSERAGSSPKVTRKAQATTEGKENHNNTQSPNATPIGPLSVDAEPQKDSSNQKTEKSDTNNPAENKTKSLDNKEESKANEDQSAPTADKEVEKEIELPATQFKFQSRPKSITISTDNFFKWNEISHDIKTLKKINITCVIDCHEIALLHEEDIFKVESDSGLIVITEITKQEHKVGGVPQLPDDGSQVTNNVKSDEKYKYQLIISPDNLKEEEIKKKTEVILSRLKEFSNKYKGVKSSGNELDKNTEYTEELIKLNNKIKEVYEVRQDYLKRVSSSNKKIKAKRDKTREDSGSSHMRYYKLQPLESL